MLERTARHVVFNGGDPSETELAVLHLIAHALELTLKAVLRREGRSARELRYPPFGHDLAYMWKLAEVEFLRQRVPEIAAHVVMDARHAGRWTDLPEGDPGALFFEQLPLLSELHSADSDFALRYPTSGNRLKPGAPFLVDVIRCLIAVAERAQVARQRP